MEKKEDEDLYYGSRKKNKVNIILIVSVYSIIEYELLTENKNSKNYEQFLIKMLDNLYNNVIKISLFIIDNYSIYLFKIFISIMKKN